MTDRPTSALLIGYGSIGRRHARVLDQRYERFAIVDFNDSAMEKARCDFPTATVVRNLGELGGLDWDWSATLGVIATWGPSHSSVFHEIVPFGVRHVLCEKPLANSVWAAAGMIRAAEDSGVTLGVHHHFRHSNFVSGLNGLTDSLGLGPATNFLAHGGAVGLVTSGIHFIDLACELFGRGPNAVMSNARGVHINPRSPELKFYGGTAAWSFDDDRQTSFTFSNSSSVAPTLSVFYREAEVQIRRVAMNDAEVVVHRRPVGEIDSLMPVTRVGEASEIVFAGPVPTLLPHERRMARLLGEIESGCVVSCPTCLGPAST